MKSVADQINEHVNGGSEKTTYLGGDLLKKGSIMLRNAEAEELRSVGVKLYSPIEDKEINDKSAVSKEDNMKLAERIVYKDTKAIIESDYIIIEPQDDAKGTMVELGQIKGMKDAARMIDRLVYNWQNEGMNEHQLHAELVSLIGKLDKKVYPHYEDIRRTNLEECGDRRSWGANQYVYGVCLDLTDGKGFYEWDEIVEEMRGIYEKSWEREYIELVKDVLKELKDGQDGRFGIVRTNAFISISDIMNTSGIEKEDFYKELYRLNDLYFKGLIFISRYLKDNNKIEVNYKCCKTER